MQAESRSHAIVWLAIKAAVDATSCRKEHGRFLANVLPKNLAIPIGYVDPPA